MTSYPEFQLEVAQNQYLAPGATQVDAILTVTAEAPEETATTAAEIVIVDCSASMYRPSKLNAAKQATMTAIDGIRDGVEFAVIAGNESARVVYPPQREPTRLAVADERTKAEARHAVAGLETSGGTAMGRWLWLADQLFATSDAEIRHAILLTDGRNDSQAPKELNATLDDIAGNFVCDCRGVGTDWEVAELRQIAHALLGSVDIVAEPADLAADFAAMTEAAMSKAVADVGLRLWTPQGARIEFVKQVEPTLDDLTEMGARIDAQSIEYPTGAWGSETRSYHVKLRVPPAGVGDKMLACRAQLVASGPKGSDVVLGKARVLAVWTDDATLSTAIDPTVAHYTGQAELADAIHAGLAARRAGDVETATQKLGRAVALATQSGHEDAVNLLAGVVEVEDAVQGTVRLKSRVSAIDEMTLDTRSTVTKRVSRRTGL
ncbi:MULTISPECIES: VWA domain-containing protein [Thermocrispum]|uniref:VWA domain-containing protein n=1 Tax=Thermocrispum agreste TaxID=37925 RepID=A0ABD6FG50_9PSEU|nr:MULTISPECIES: VWA domain-containing protein [Thermocrispum]